MDETACSVEGCTRPRRYVAKGWCATHYVRWKRTGDVLAEARRYERVGPECSVEGCGRTPKTRGMCGMHYQRWRDAGDPGPAGPLTPVTTGCSVEGCDRPHHTRGFCDPHYLRWKKDGDPRPDVPLQVKTPLPDECEVEGCSDRAKARRMCSAHYRQVKAGLPVTKKRVYAPAGTGHINKNGYRVLSVDGRSRFEHRILAEEALGRPLQPGEEIHHINGDRLGNWVDGPFVLNERGNLASGNLEIWSTSQPKGQDVGAKVEWAVGLLELYGKQLTSAQVGRLAAVVALAGSRFPLRSSARAVGSTP